MRYPVAQNKTDFEKNWYIAQGFGAKTSYGYHEGVDLNLKTGGNTDLGQPLYAVADGKIVYYHKNKHPKSGFGLHMVLEVDTARGKRWFHYAHCLEITNKVKLVKEGDIIGKLGSTGNSKYAHLHFACFKVDPASLPRGIDTIAKTKQQLLDWWEDPLQVIEGSMQGDYYKGLDLNNKESMKVAVDMWYAVVKEGKYVEKEKFEEVKIVLKQTKEQLKEKDKIISELNRKIALLEKQVETTKNKAEADLEKARIDYEKKLKDIEIRMSKDFELKEKQYKDEIAKLQEDLKKREIVVKKELEVPRDFRRRFILALEILLGVYDG